MTTTGILPPPSAPAPGRQRRRPLPWLGSLAGVTLFLSTGCSLLGATGLAAPESSPHSIDPNVPFVVVTVGGLPAATATQGVAATIPDSTPLPRIDPPTRDPAATARPVASPSASRSASAASRAARPPDNAIPVGSPGPTGRTP